MTYNIKTGGYDGTDSSRLDAVLRVVAALAPDVLALEELRGFDRSPLLRRISSALGMVPTLARSLFGQPVAVLVRPPFPVLSARSVAKPFHHAAARVVVGTARGPLTVVGTHLHPHFGTRRLWEARWAAGALRGAELGVVMGDLNALDPWTAHEERLARLPMPFRGRHLTLRGRIDTRAVTALARAGLVDVFHAAEPQEAKAAVTRRVESAPTGLGGKEFSGMRLDYLFATPALAALVRDCRIVDGGETDVASDHYPVVADVDLDPPPST
jgi:endonuclease/exonuclease/phosphatase family metal-dependent hydrolase